MAADPSNNVVASLPYPHARPAAAMSSRRGRRHGPPGGTLFASADAMVAVRLAKMSIADSQRALRDKSIYKPHTPLIREGRGKKPRRPTTGADNADRVATAPRITKKYRRERPWLSAREVRERVREDEREVRAGMRLRHSFGFNSTQTLTNPDFKMNLRSMKRIEGDKCVHTPRESMHLERVKLPPVVVVEPPKPADYFGFGDMVRLISAPDALEFGCLKNWRHDKEQAGKVIIGGRRWKGDCLVEFSGQRLWMKQDELEMLERNPEPRPTTAEELKVMNKRKAAERKKRMKAKRAAQLKYNLKMQEGEENTMATEEVEDFFKQIDVDDGGTLDTDEMRQLMKRLGQPSDGEGFAIIMHEMDGDGSGEVDCSEFLDWWKRAGKERREEITRYNDKRREIREIFDEIDTDGSGEVDAEEVAQLVETLGIKMSPSELEEAMLKMDADGSGEVEFEEFYAWWMDATTQGFMKKSRERMEAVKVLFDTLDDDGSGALSREEVVKLAKSLGASLTRVEVDAAMKEMDKDGSEEVDFLEFYAWWNGAADGVLAQAKIREEKRNAMWKKVESIEGTYSRHDDSDIVQMKSHLKDNALRRRLEEQGGGGPRLRRCTVMEIGATLGGGTGADDDDDDDMVQTELLQQLLQHCEDNQIDAAREMLVEGHNGQMSGNAKTALDVNDELLGVTPLMIASSHGHVELALMLLERGALVNAVDLDGSPAIQWAADAKSGSSEETVLDKRLQEVITVLMANGAEDPTGANMDADGVTLDSNGSRDVQMNDKLLRAAENEELKQYMLKMDLHTAISATTAVAEAAQEAALEGIESEEVKAEVGASTYIPSAGIRQAIGW